MIGVLDIGGTKIAAGMVDETGRLLAQLETPTETYKGAVDGIRGIAAMLRQAASQVGGSLQGIGISCTGQVQPEVGTVGKNEFLPGWEFLNLVEEFSRAFDVPVALENDANAAALGEWAWGAGRRARQFLLATVGTGIGVGLVVDGRLYRGVDGSHPEIGHHIIDPSGPSCFCGARGCWESLASGTAMERWAQANHPEGKWTSARQLCILAGEGEPLALEAARRTARYLGLGVANLMTLFSPESIALGGGLMQSGSLFWPEIRAAIQASCGLVPRTRVQVVPASLGVQAALVGAAQVWYHRYTP